MRGKKEAKTAVSVRIKELRDKLGMTQTDFAFALSTRPSTVSKWESGHNRPNPDVFVRLARLADDLDKFFFLEQAGLPEHYLDGRPMSSSINRAATEMMAESLGLDAKTFVPFPHGEAVTMVPLVKTHQLGDPNATVEQTFPFPAQWLPRDGNIQAAKLFNNLSPIVSGELTALIDISKRDPDRLQGCVVATRTPDGIAPMTLKKDGGTYFLVSLFEAGNKGVRVLRPAGDWSIVGRVVKWIGDAPSAPPDVSILRKSRRAKDA